MSLGTRNRMAGSRGVEQRNGDLSNMSHTHEGKRILRVTTSEKLQGVSRHLVRVFLTPEDQKSGAGK